MLFRSQYGASQSALLFQQARKQMLDVELLMAVSGGQALRCPDRLLELFRETIDVHVYIVDRNSPPGIVQTGTWVGGASTYRPTHRR